MSTGPQINTEKRESVFIGVNLWQFWFLGIPLRPDFLNIALVCRIFTGTAHLSHFVG